MAEFLPVTAKIRATNFRPMFVQAVTPIRGGDAQAVDLGETLWICDLETTPLTRAQASQYRALLMRQRGAMGSLYIYDAFCQRPAGHPRVSGDSEEWYASEETWFASEDDGWDSSGVVRPWGAPTVIGYDQDNSLLQITGFDPAADIREGDFGHWDDGVTRRLAMVVEAPIIAADGSCWLKIEPPPPASSTELPALFVMDKASAEMRIASFDAPVSVGENLWRVTMTAAQILRRST